MIFRSRLIRVDTAEQKTKTSAVAEWRGGRQERTRRALRSWLEASEFSHCESGIGGVAGDFGEHQEDFCEKYESVEMWGFYRIFQQPEGPKSPVVF